MKTTFFHAKLLCFDVWPSSLIPAVNLLQEEEDDHPPSAAYTSKKLTLTMEDKDDLSDRIVDSSDEDFRPQSSMEVETTSSGCKCVLPPSGRWNLNNDCKETSSSLVMVETASIVISEEEGSPFSESGDDLFPSVYKRKSSSLVWSDDKDENLTSVTSLPTCQALSEVTEIVPYNQARVGGNYANSQNEAEADISDNNHLVPIHERTVENARLPIKRKRATGLGNLGNTCFMNSTLQCLAHTGPLIQYFLSGEFRKDLNKDNPLGTGGELATEFADLMHQMWFLKNDESQNHQNNDGVYSSSRVYSPSNYDSGVSLITYPRSFKYTLGKYAEQFMGYDQHDSQELAIYLLDALHEDTNRVTKKPYVEKPEQEEDESDVVAAEKAWSVHLQRENSRVFENFMGQIKSRLQCTSKGCDRVSTTFDPSMYLSVPIPGSTDREIKVTFVPLDHNLTCAELKVKLCKNSTIAGLRKHLADLVKECYGWTEDDLLEENIQLADYYQEKIYTCYAEDHNIDRIKDSDETYAYQVYPLSSLKNDYVTYMKNQKKSADLIANLDYDTENNNFLLDAESRIELDETCKWQKKIERYVSQTQLAISRLMNEKRSSHAERLEFYEKMIRFITKCRTCQDCKNVSDVDMEEKSDKVEPERRLQPIEVSEPPGTATLLADVCDMTRLFRNVNSSHDVAILEYCAFKFKSFVHEGAHPLNINENGFLIQIAFQRNLTGDKSSVSAWKRFGKPILARIPSTLTVSELRSTIGLHLSHLVKVDNTTGHPTSFESGDMSTLTAIMNQVAISYDDKLAHDEGIVPIGSVTVHQFMDNTPSFARSCEEKEKQPIAKLFSHKDITIILSFPTRLNDIIGDDAISISEPFLSKAQKVEMAKLKDNKVSVMDCISKFCQTEQLDENDMWYCNRCKQRNQAFKECHLYRTPPILIIHLKRFHFSSSTHRRDKIDTLVDFPLNDLDLREKVTFWENGEDPIYDCYAVSNHFGGLGGGHYTAYAKGDDGTWTNFDDSRVTTGVNESEVVSNAAYCLYYKRKDVVNCVMDTHVLSQGRGTEKELAKFCEEDISQEKMIVDTHSSTNDSICSTSSPVDTLLDSDNVFMSDERILLERIGSDHGCNFPLQ